MVSSPIGVLPSEPPQKTSATCCHKTEKHHKRYIFGLQREGGIVAEIVVVIKAFGEGFIVGKNEY